MPKKLKKPAKQVRHPFWHVLETSGRRPFLSRESNSKTYQDFSFGIRAAVQGLQKQRANRIGIYAEDIFDFLTHVIAAEYLGKSVICLSPELSSADVTKLLHTTRAELLVSRRKISKKMVTILPYKAQKNLPPLPKYKKGEIILTTSGSTGVPKGVIHQWESLLDAVSVKEEGARAKWFLTYDFTSFAGLQVIFHALLNSAQLIRAERDTSLCLKRFRPTHISGTPSFWRKMIHEMPRNLVLQHITLGGEAVTQELLNQLLQRFPRTPMTQIYASTEMGVCFAVRDKKAGIPLAEFKKQAGIRAKVVRDQLYVSSKRSMKGYVGHASGSRWFATGDVVRKNRGRIYFMGRKQEILNVGGFKVYPQEVEEVICRVPGVVRARVYGQASSLMGQMVAAEVEPRANFDRDKLQNAIYQKCRVSLARPKIPRLIEFRKVNLTAAGKLNRRTGL